MSLLKSAISGVKWTSISAVVQALVHLLRIAILTRFLDKADFGVMAILLFIVGFLNLFMDMGTTSAILHKQDISTKEYSSLYWINIGFSIVVYLVIVFLAPFIASFYSMLSLVPLIALMSTGVIINAIGRQSKTILQKELNFRTIGIIDSTAALLSLGISIVLAYLGYGIYSLIFGVLFQYSFSNFLFYFFRRKKDLILFFFSYTLVKPFLKIGLYQVGGQILNYFSRDIDLLIIGKLFGTGTLGVYSLAKQLVNSPLQLVNPILVKVASPILVKFQKNVEMLRHNYLKLVNVVATVNIPLYLFLFIFAPLIVEIIYGDQFLDAVLPVRVLSIYMAIRSLGNPVSSLVIATGRTDLEFFWNLFVLFTVPFSIFIGSYWGINGVLTSLLISRLVIFVPGWYLLLWRTVQIPFWSYCKAIMPNFKDAKLLLNRSKQS